MDLALLEPHRRTLWGLGYRMLGLASEADDLVQDTFVRAMERPPVDTLSDLRPWLIRVAANMARDRLRARKVRGYAGPWLPEPVVDEIEGHAPNPERFASQREQIRYGLLVALEQLNENQRAVWCLRDGLGFSVRETADALQLSEANVKTTLHRARAAIDGDETIYDLDIARSVVERLLVALTTGDLAATRALLSDEVTSHSDGGGRFSAARKVVVGADRVSTLLHGLVQRHAGGILGVRQGVFGTLVGVLVDRVPDPGIAPRNLLLFDLDSAGRVSAIYSLLDDGTGKLAEVTQATA